MIDLHCHSNYSDGLWSPALLLERALRAGVSLLALTDHDTTMGIPELQQAAKNRAIRIIPGIELSVQWKKYDIHVLGFNINIQDPGLQDVIALQEQRRIARAQAIGDALERLGLKDAYAKTCALAGHTRIGRAHFAQILLQEGMVKEPKAAFKVYLGRGKVAYVPSSWINLSTAVDAINGAGGQAVIAHPLKYGLTRLKLHELIHEFQTAGGIGIEVVSGDIMSDDIEKMANVCAKYDLLASSGSDYHGEGMSRIGLGRQKALPSHCTPIWSSW